jgi:hypothetical protein
MTVVYDGSTFMPAVRAAAGLAPTARSLNPSVLRSSSQAVPAAAASASSRPKCTRRSPPSRCGSRAVSLTFREIAWLNGGAWNHETDSSQPSRLSAT